MLAETYPIRVLLMTFTGLVNRQPADVIAYLVEENRVLKEQMKGRKLRLTDDQRRRLAVKAKVLGRRTLNAMATIVTPDILMRWHKRLIAAKWTYAAPKHVGYPGLMRRIKVLIVRMAKENSSWGCTRIQGELKGVGHAVARSTVANVLQDNGIKPAPDRPSSWKSFLKAHWGQIAATDFFSVEVWTPRGLKTYYVLFFIDLKTRVVEIAGITTSPNEAFMAQVARNLTVPVTGFLRKATLLICDRDTKYTVAVKKSLENAGTKTALTPYRAPNCNAYAERFVFSIKSECLSKMICFGEASLRRAINGYIEHYNTERPHQGTGNVTIQRPEPSIGDIECNERLGGLLKSYRRAA
ncbi:MAG: putative transposase [Candidatus Paceibacteria bacterium]|jgi:putative transposase